MVDLIALSGLELQILQHVSMASASGRQHGEEGWLGRPFDPGEEYDKAIDRLISVGAFETRTIQNAPWVRTTEMGESMLAQAQAARAEKQ